MVRIEDGQFHSAEGLSGHELTTHVHGWAKHIIGSDDLDFMINAIRETRELELWKRNIGGSTFDTIEDFLKRKLHLPTDFHYSKFEQLVTEVSKVKKTKPKTLKELREYRNERIREAAENFTQKQVAENFGLTDRQVRSILKAEVKLHNVEKTSALKEPLETITLSDNPIRAAEQIVNKFGVEFSNQLKINL